MAKLSLLLLSCIYADQDSCPSTECWTWNSVTNVCDLKVTNTECAYSVTCAHATGMTVTMNDKLFGSDANSDWAQEAGGACDLTHATDTWTMTESLGTCGQVLSREEGTNGDPDYIVFTKTLTLGAGTHSGSNAADILGAAITLYLTPAAGGVTVDFKCKFASTATATSEEIGVAPHVAVSGEAATSIGVWDDSMTLKYYVDNTFGTELTEGQHSVFIGATMFVRSEWTVTTLTSSLRYYISKCTVSDVSSDTVVADRKAVAIVDGTCYASAIGAMPLGGAATDSAIGKIVTATSDFQYTSFSFDTSGNDQQELTCTVNFCIVANADGGLGDCPAISWDDENGNSGGDPCPTTTGFIFKA